MPSFLEILKPDGAMPDPGIDAADKMRVEAAKEKKQDANPADLRVTTVAKDGSKEITNPDGSKINVDAAGKITKITRLNGTVIDCIYTGGVMTQINETRNGKTTEWKKDATENRWRSMDHIGAQRINFTVNDKGQTSFEDVAGTTYISNGDGSQRRVKLDKSVVEIDSDWHITSVTRPDGSKITCKHANGKLSEITESKNGQDVVWSYDDKKDEWTSQQSPEIRKNMSVSDLGNFVYVSARNNDVVHIDYADGVTRDFEWNNGQVQKIIENSPAGKVTWTRDGTTDNFINGTTKEVRKNVTVGLDGEFSYVDGKGFKRIHKFDVTEEIVMPTEITRSKAVQDARDDLLKSVKNTMKAGDEAKFTADLDKFEARAHAMGLKENQVVESMKQLKLILESTVQKPFVTAERVKLAQETLQAIAKPRGVDQGYHDTCGAATAQVYVCTLYPEKFASLIREVADTGKFKANSGNVIQPDDASLRQDREANARSPYDANAWGRSYASQIYQVVGINAAYTILGSQYRYAQGRSVNPKDTGERLIRKSDGKEFGFSGMYDNEVVQVTKETCGNAVTILRRGTNFGTTDELRNQLTGLQKQQQLPAVMWVSTKNEPFWTATGRGRGGGVPGGHYVTIWDIDNNDRIGLDNQWGRSGDYESLKRLRLQQAFDASNP